jgi:isoleucyl-tRNA synthetase
MGDWMISKKRYWGLALPIWVDQETGEFEVIGSRQELKERAVEGWSEFDGHTPHRPWIDKIKIRSRKTGKLLSRISDVGNPWLDAGVVAFSTMGFSQYKKMLENPSANPHSEFRNPKWEEWYPADFITESFPGQFRNWFYALLALSTVMARDTEKAGQPPFKCLLGHGLVLDEKGETMSKSKGNSIAFDEAADKMGADVCRWLYCRSEPASNISFGYKAADELRAKFVLKLWNTYAFFVNYARLDGFDPTSSAARGLAGLQDIDRWILSDLQLLIKKARESFEAFDVQSFCLETEKFVDDKLSNWYIRRNRRRFWKSEAGSDKMAAYQTLYTVLTTLTRLIAPVVPFLAETMWQNLKPVGSGQWAVGSEESVHLTDYPVADDKLIDQQLSEDMEALLRLVSLGGAARNLAKIKVRQPLSELKVQAASDVDRRAVERFADQLQEELNVKRTTLHVPPPPLLKTEIKLNMKTAGPRLGAKLKDVQGVIAVANALRLSEQLRAGPVELSGMSVELADVTITYSAPEGWAGVADRGTQVALDTRITPELAREGMARDVIRQVQDLRKNADLQMEDRIVLCLATDSAELKLAIDTHRNYIAAETLTMEWTDTPFDPHSANVKIDGQALTISLRKV